MAFGRDDVCEHGSLKRKCDSCALLEADSRVAELETILREAHDALLMSEAVLRKHTYEATANEVKRVYDKVCAAVTMTAVQ